MASDLHHCRMLTSMSLGPEIAHHLAWEHSVQHHQVVTYDPIRRHDMIRVHGVHELQVELDPPAFA